MNPPVALSMDGKIPELTLGWRMRMARVQAGIGAEEMADRLGYQRGAPTRWEKDEIKPRTSVLIGYAAHTGVSLLWLQTGETPPPDDGGEPVTPIASRKTPSGATKRRSTTKKANSPWNSTPAAAREGAPSRRSTAPSGNSPKGVACRQAA